MKKIIIVGAGIAGLTAGIYGRLNGFHTEIFELHTQPGGECTGWDRGEYHFDGCIHWMMGTKQGVGLNKLWYEVGALDDSVGILNNKEFVRYALDGREFKIYRDVDKLEKHMLELSPQDEQEIRALCKAVRKLSGLDIPVDKPADMMNVLDILKILPMGLKMVSLGKYAKISVIDLANRFKDPLIRLALSSIMPSPYSATSLVMTLASLNDDDSGWPMGGSLRVAKRMEQRYLKLGGKVNYGKRVEKAIIKDGRAVGIRLKDGSEHFGDYVISAADGHFTLFEMLDGKHLTEELKEMYSNNTKYPLYTTCQVSFGIDCDLSNRPHAYSVKPEQPLDGGGLLNDTVGFRHFCYDPAIAPKGKSSVTCLLNADFEYWKRKKKNPAEYRREKELLLQRVQALLQEIYPEVEGKIEKTDVATPMTYVRYCNAWKGAWMSFMITPGTKMSFAAKGDLPGLENFYMAGQWTSPPGGLPGAVMPGKFVICRLCKKEGRKFKTQI